MEYLLFFNESTYDSNEPFALSEKAIATSADLPSILFEWRPAPLFFDHPVILVLGLYLVFLIYHVGNRGASYRARHTALHWHVTAGVTEVILYYAGFKCSLAAVVACCIHSWTSLRLVKHLRKGYPPITRPSYQAGPFIRTYAIIYAYATGSALDYHDAIMPLNAFVYTRGLIFLFATMGPTASFHRNVNSKYIYMFAVTGGAIMGISHCHSQWAVAQYLILVHVVGKLNTWTRMHVDANRKLGKPQPRHIRMLQYLGFCNFEVPSDESMQCNINDGPKIGLLRMDEGGHSWTKLFTSSPGSECDLGG